MKKINCDAIVPASIDADLLTRLQCSTWLDPRRTAGIGRLPDRTEDTAMTVAHARHESHKVAA